jgi:hypothetical protein|eukprot:SAG31_NODE_4097_length_3590_cov_3.464353_4_plen_63_part_00
MGRKKIPLLKKKKHRKHDKIVNDYENQKQKHLEKLASKMLDKQDKISILREKKVDKGFLDLF